ncbi:MAG: BatA domain-containing protein [Planctomycetota bacterium]
MAFQFAPVLWAAGAAAAPVVIHMIMRTRARRIKFPAVEFVRKSHQANIKMHRLKHLLLLLMRMAAIILVVLLIARASVSDWRMVPVGDEPAAVAIVIDNGGSMGYRSGGQTSLGRGKALAQRLIGSLPEGSRVAVVATASPAGGVGPISPKRAADLVAAIEGTPGDEPLAPALREAAKLLDNVTDLKRKEVYVISDMTAQSWREGSGLNLVAHADKRFVIIDYGAKDVNAALGDVRLSAWNVPVDARLAIRTEVRRPKQGLELSLTVDLDGRLAYQKILDDVLPGQVRPVTLPVRPTREGVLAGRVALAGLGGRDPLALDNERHFTLEAGSPIRVLLVRDRATVRMLDPTSLLMELAFRPKGNDASSWQGVRLVLLTSDRLERSSLEGMDFLLLANVSALAGAQWGAIRDYVQDGGRLWVVPGSFVSPEKYNASEAQAIMPAGLGALERLPGSIGWRLADPRQADDLVEPFLSGENPPLTAVRCRRRFGIESIADGARAVLSYSDGVPAVLRRDVGEGTVIFWNFSPAGDFSNLAGRRQFVVLTYSTLRMAMRGRKTMYFYSDAVTVPAPQGMGRPFVEVQRPGENFRAAEEGRTAPGALTISRVDRLGQWRVRFSQAGRKTRTYGFSVNASYAESNLEPAKEKEVRDMFPPGRVVITKDVRKVGELAEAVPQELDLTVPVLIGLLILVTLESLFANRFYRAAAGAGKWPAASCGEAISG